MRLAGPSDNFQPPGDRLEKKNLKIFHRKIWRLRKSPYLCSRNRDDSDKFFENITYQQVVQETYIDTKHTVKDYDKDEILSEDIKQFQQRRV